MYGYSREAPLPGMAMLMTAAAMLPGGALAVAGMQQANEDLQRELSMQNLENQTRALLPGVSSLPGRTTVKASNMPGWMKTLGGAFGVGNVSFQRGGMGLAGYGARFGFMPGETEMRLGMYARGGLSGAHTSAIAPLLLAMERGAGIDAGVAAQFLGQYRAGGGGEGALAGPGALTRQFGVGVASARAAGLNNADLAGYLATIAQRTTQLAQQGIAVDPRSAAAMAEMVGAATGARGQRRLGLGQGIESILMGTADGGGDAITQYMALQAVGLGKDGVGVFEARRRLKDPNRSASTLKAIIEQVRKLPGSADSKAALLETRFGLSPEEALAAVGGGDLPSGAPPDAPGNFAGSMYGAADAATGAESRRRAALEAKKIGDARKAGTPGSVMTVMERAQPLAAWASESFAGLFETVSALFTKDGWRKVSDALFNPVPEDAPTDGSYIPPPGGGVLMPYNPAINQQRMSLEIGLSPAAEQLLQVLQARSEVVG